MRNAYFQSVGKREFGELSPQEAARAKRENPQLAQLMAELPITQLRYVRPEKVLPVGVVGFDEQESIGEAYRIGWEDGGRGFTSYDWQTFQL